MTTAYTHLESLLLFQALRAEGVQPTSFNRISDQLKNIPLVRNDPHYDGGRLSPDALRELYLFLLKEEIKQDLERQANADNPRTNGHVSPGSRKRKAASPVLPTVREAEKHSHLIPQLVTRLYARYRDTAVKRLKDYEKKYSQIKQDIVDIEAGRWDERLQQNQRQQTASVTPKPSPKSSPKPSSTAHTQPVLPRADHVQPTPPRVTVSPIPPQTLREGQAAPKPYSQAKIDAVINHGPEPQDSPGAHRRVSSNTKLPPLSEMAPQSPHFGIPPTLPGPGAHQQMQPIPHPSNNGYGHSPPAGHQSPYASQHTHPRSASMASPQVQQSMSQPSSSPRPILPPPPGMKFPPPTSVQHIGSPGSHAPPMPPQQYPPPHYMPSGQSPTVNMPPRAYPGAPLPPHTPQYFQQQPYPDRRTSYVPQQPHQSPAYPSRPAPPQSGGYMLEPFQVGPQDPTKSMQQQQHRPQQSPAPIQRPQQHPQSHLPHAIAHNTTATAPRPQPISRMVSDIVSVLATPPRPKVKSIWKPSPIVGTPKPRPDIEPLSPKMERPRSPARSSRSTRGRDIPVVEEPMQPNPTPKTRTSKRRARARDRSPHSVVSSTADESLRARTRSHSVSTATGFNPRSDDRPGSRNGVKAEPSTPANMLDDAEPMPAPSASSASGMMTRKRRGTIQSQPLLPSKRKRQESPSASAVDEHEALSTPPPKSNTVIATRNFAKMSSAIMNDITSHKHASYFAKEVRDKDAPGYSGIVRQPQNLKSIRSAITAGARAVAAAASSVDSTAETPIASTPRGADGSAIVELERTVDLIPPKAIVNGAQLEKELLRMFANAYMFNPGEDGMALSTKEMFLDVEQKLNDWRGTERLAGGDDEEDGKGKRRKM